MKKQALEGETLIFYQKSQWWELKLIVFDL